MDNPLAKQNKPLSGRFVTANACFSGGGILRLRQAAKALKILAYLFRALGYAISPTLCLLALKYV